MRPNGAVAEVNQALSGQLVRAATEEGFRGKAEQTFVLHTHGRLPARGWCWSEPARGSGSTPSRSARRPAAG